MVLPILFVLIVVFGHGENRFRSAFLLFLYTLAGSLPMLLSILTIYSYLDSTDYQLISFNEISLESQKWLWIGFFFALAVKTPLVPFSIWLPKAHGDSPLAGSIILAATILKLATYFYLRVLINYLPDASNYFSPLVQTIAVISIIYASFATIVQEDTKRLIAYSSVAPIGPLNIVYLMPQTICVKPNGLNRFYLGTNKIIYYLNKEIQLKNSNILVKNLNNYLGNTQIINICLKIYKIFNFFKNKLFFILIEISETIRLLLTNIIILFNSYSTFFVCVRSQKQKKHYNFNYNNYSNFAYSNLIQTIYDYNSNSENNNKDSALALERSRPRQELSLDGEAKQFYEWLAGLIDGDGYFWIRKINRLSSLVITFDIRDIQTAQMIKDRLGGNLNILRGNNAVRFKLHKYDAIVSLVNNINGLIRTPNRIEQLKLVCLNYGIEYKNPIKLEFNNAWFSGFFDSDGHVSYNKSHGSINICITQKNKNLLLELASIYDGKVYSHSKNSDYYRFIISNKSNVLTILNDYFNKYPSRSMKQNRLMLIKKYYELRIMKCHLAPKGSSLHKAWVEFNQNWLNYNYY